MTSDSAKTERTTRRANLGHFEKVATRVGVGLVIAGPVLAIVAIVLGSAEIFPYEYTVTVALTVMLVPIGAALLIGAVGGLYIMGGPKVAPLGVIFVAGFGLLVYGLVGGRQWATTAGVLLLAVSGAIFYVLGSGSGRAPASTLGLWGHPVALVVGLALAVVGFMVGVWWIFLFGSLAFGCGLGTVLARWWHRRRTQ